MAYFGEASKNVIEWIESDPARLEDFKTNYGGYSVQEYLNRFCYDQGIVARLVRSILTRENERTVKRICML